MRLSLSLLIYRPVIRAIMDLIRSVDLGVLVLGFISPPGYF
ncbi:Beta-carotene hydroxylase [Crocosphaera watsonii WH 8502]|uniref:Beta-carotene hydroxylase n=2 Tax=Crocosphaera watsonii TaxID=263511 RepID=T2JG50_CROWT|nr:Beta-carotene hydroxylase [Crocosphaera watsonii WH 8502]CCQ64813.1 Beta-carotene hydroxylase [Crocosphaera watsonii WH 0402]